MKIKNVLLVMLPTAVSSCVIEKPVDCRCKKIDYPDENLKKQLEDIKTNFEKASNGNLSDFIKFEEQIIDKVKKEDNRIKDESGKQFTKSLKDENTLNDLKNKFGNLGTAMFLDSNLKFFLNPVYQETNRKTNFVNDFFNKRDEINNKINSVACKDIKVSLFDVKNLKFDDLSKIFDFDYKCQDLNEWFKLVSLFGYYSVENLLLPVEFKDDNGNNIGKGFVCDGLNCIQWGLLFEKNVSEERQEKCFNTMKEIFKNVVLKDNTIISKKIRFFCNEKSIWDKLSAFYKESTDEMFFLDKLKDYSKWFCHCCCYNDITDERFLNFGFPCVGFAQRNGLYCCNFSGSLKKSATTV